MRNGVMGKLETGWREIGRLGGWRDRGKKVVGNWVGGKCGKRWRENGQWVGGKGGKGLEGRWELDWRER